MKETFEVDRVCPSCVGTGLYVGMAERRGAAVECHQCKGSGCERFKVTFTRFVARERRDDVTVVLAVNPGIVVAPDVVPGGCSYEEWWADRNVAWKPGREMREHTCPAWWYQSADYNRKPNWNECYFGAFQSCTHFCDKGKCWERWDAENAAQVA